MKKNMIKSSFSWIILSMAFMNLTACNPDRDNPMDPESEWYDESMVSSNNENSSNSEQQGLYPTQYAQLFDTVNHAIEMIGEIEEDYVIESGYKYRLKGMVYVKEGATLFIKPGAEIVADGPNSGLVILPDADIYANGGTQGIEFDRESEAALTDLNRWRGITIMGNASVANDTAIVFEANQKWVASGDDDLDNSGVFKGVKIRFAGVGDAPALRLVGVGANTQIEHIYINNYKSAGVELIGGRVNLNYLITINQGNDSVSALYAHSQYNGIVSHFGCRNENVSSRCVTLGGDLGTNGEHTTLTIEHSTLSELGVNNINSTSIFIKEHALLNLKNSVLFMKDKSTVFKVSGGQTIMSLGDFEISNNFYTGINVSKFVDDEFANVSTTVGGWLDGNNAHRFKTVPANDFLDNGFVLQESSEASQANAGAFVGNIEWEDSFSLEGEFSNLTLINAQ